MMNKERKNKHVDDKRSEVIKKRGRGSSGPDGGSMGIWILCVCFPFSYVQEKKVNLWI